jgi:hypothetical protein
MGAAVAVILMKERHIAEAFQRAGVVSPERARAPEELNIGTHGVAWRRLRDQAIVREASAGRYYLDVLSWEASIRMRRKRMAIALLIVILAAVAYYGFGPRQP